MHVNNTEVEVAGYDSEEQAFFGFVTFVYTDTDSDTAGQAHFACRAPLGADTPSETVVSALMKEARRQLSRMPEFLMGQRTLSFAGEA